MSLFIARPPGSRCRAAAGSKRTLQPVAGALLTKASSQNRELSPHRKSFNRSYVMLQRRAASAPRRCERVKLSFNEQLDLAALPAELKSLEGEQAALPARMSDGNEPICCHTPQ